MGLPKQVQKDIEAIAAHDAAQKAEQERAAAPVEQTVEAANQDVSPEVPAAVTPTEPVENSQPPVATAKEDEELWKHRYLTLQGIQQAEARSTKELKQQFEQLQAEITKLKAAPVSVQSLVSDEEKSEFGEDLIDVQRRIAKEELAPLTAQMEALAEENKKLREQLSQVDATVASSGFEQRLKQAVPDFYEINDDPRWVAWLDEVDPILRAPRRSVAQAAYERGDVEATSAYVKMFKSTITSVAPSKADKELNSQVAPSKSSTATSPTDSSPRVYTEAEAGQLFDKVGQLYRQGKTEEASKLDAELTLAYHEGRVR